MSTETSSAPELHPEHATVVVQLVERICTGVPQLVSQHGPGLTVLTLDPVSKAYVFGYQRQGDVSARTLKGMGLSKALAERILDRLAEYDPGKEALVLVVEKGYVFGAPVSVVKVNLVEVPAEEVEAAKPAAAETPFYTSKVANG
jgi:hypothetical protein